MEVQVLNKIAEGIFLCFPSNNQNLKGGNHMKCTNPLCIHYYEFDISPTKVSVVCLKHEFEINYQNLTKIENCQDHKTYEQVREDWKNYLKID